MLHEVNLIAYDYVGYEAHDGHRLKCRVTTSQAKAMIDEICAQCGDHLTDAPTPEEMGNACPASTNTKRDDICPKCDYEYPHLFKDGHYKCDECGFVWVGQTSPVL